MVRYILTAGLSRETGEEKRKRKREQMETKRNVSVHFPFCRSLSFLSLHFLSRTRVQREARQS